MPGSVTRRELLAGAGVATAVGPLAGRAGAAQPVRPLRVLTTGIEWPAGMHDRLQLDLGFSITLQLVDSVQQVAAVLAGPDSFDIFSGFSHQAMRVWFSGRLRPVDTRRILAWPDVYRLLTWGKPAPGSNCPYGVGDAPFRSLFLRAGTSGLPESSARPPATNEIAQWIDERSGRPHGGQPMPRYVVGVPVHFAAESLGYLPQVIPKRPAKVSWAELLNRRWHGRVGLQNDPGGALVDLGRAVESSGIMRIGNVGAMTAQEIDRLMKVTAVYRKQGQFRAVWSSFNDSVNLVASKDVAITPLWPSAAARLAAEGIPIASALPPEGYRGTCSAIGISSRVAGRAALDRCYAFLNLLYEGFFGATMMRQGYYVANGSSLPGWIRSYGAGPVRPFTLAEYAYWYGGARAAHALPDVKGGLAIRKGEIRAGGSLAARTCRSTAWSTYFHSASLQARRFAEFVQG